MALFTDQLGRTIELTTMPRRIISLVPSQTELLHYLGLGDRVVGITRFCVHPEEWLRTKPHVGGTKQYDFAQIRELEPDLILGNREENEQTQIEALGQEFPVWMSDIFDVPDALSMIESVGGMVSKQAEAAHLVAEIKLRFAALAEERARMSKKEMRAAYFIWRRPSMVAGHSTFITQMMRSCGLMNVFEGNAASRYPEITVDELRDAAPELLLLSSEPYPFAKKHVEEFRAMMPAARVMLVDGEIFSWYGPRLLRAPYYFRSLLASTAGCG